MFVFTCATCMLGAMRPEEGIIATNIGVAGVCESPCECLEPKSGPLEEQSMRLTDEESSSLGVHHFLKSKRVINWRTGRRRRRGREESKQERRALNLALLAREM